MMETMNSITSLIKASNVIIILPHIMADGDTLGSSLALHLALEKVGKKSYILIDEEIPTNLRFITKGQTIISNTEHLDPDLVIAVDCSDEDRLGQRKNIFRKVPNSINIDHHKTNTLFAKNNLVDYSAAATGEIIYNIIQYLGISICKDIASSLYVAISTDTGSFKYDNTTSNTHMIAAALLNHGINLNDITTALYQNKPLYKLRLMIAAMNTLEFHYSSKLGIMLVSTKMIQEVGARQIDVDGLIETVRDIEGVEVGVLLKEISDGEVKVGFRAKHDVDVSVIAGHFGGGGHKKASGCTIYDNLTNAKDSIIQIMDNYLR